jgi:hypothetical protein
MYRHRGTGLSIASPSHLCGDEETAQCLTFGASLRPLDQILGLKAENASRSRWAVGSTVGVFNGVDQW